MAYSHTAYTAYTDSPDTIHTGRAVYLLKTAVISRLFGKLDSVCTKASDATIISNVISYHKTDRSVNFVKKKSFKHEQVTYALPREPSVVQKGAILLVCEREEKLSLNTS